MVGAPHCPRCCHVRRGRGDRGEAHGVRGVADRVGARLAIAVGVARDAHQRGAHGRARRAGAAGAPLPPRRGGASPAPAAPARPARRGHAGSRAPPRVHRGRRAAPCGRRGDEHQCVPRRVPRPPGGAPARPPVVKALCGLRCGTSDATSPTETSGRVGAGPRHAPTATGAGIPAAGRSPASASNRGVAGRLCRARRCHLRQGLVTVDHRVAVLGSRCRGHGGSRWCPPPALAPRDRPRRDAHQHRRCSVRAANNGQQRHDNGSGSSRKGTENRGGGKGSGGGERRQKEETRAPRGETDGRPRASGARMAQTPVHPR